MSRVLPAEEEPRYALPWKAVIDNCTPRQVAVLMMWQFGGMNYAQIAARLGCSESTVGRDVERSVKIVAPKLEVSTDEQ